MIAAWWKSDILTSLQQKNTFIASDQGGPPHGGTCAGLSCRIGSCVQIIENDDCSKKVNILSQIMKPNSVVLLPKSNQTTTPLKCFSASVILIG